MEGNFSCSYCSLPAAFICICIPEKVYLCAQCIGVHCQKGGAHAIIPASAQEVVPNPQQIEGYNRKLQVVRELTAHLDQMSESLTTERSQLGASLNKAYTEQANLLYSAYVKTGEDLNTVYQSLSEEFQRVKEEILQPRDTLAQSTKRFVSVAAHIQENQHTYVNVQDEWNKRINLTLVDVQFSARSLPSLIDEWGMKICSCRNCLLYQGTLKIEPDLELPALCKHFPWLNLVGKYSCCGKLYPCFGCHNEKESHELICTEIVCRVCQTAQLNLTKQCVKCRTSFRYQ